MMTRRIPAVCVVLVLFVAVPATAQTPQQERLPTDEDYIRALAATAQTFEQERLQGVAEVYVTIENLNDNAATCGVTEAGLTTAASKALLDNGVRITDRYVVDSEEAAYFRQHGWVDSEEKGPLPIPRLYVNINTLYFETNQQCVSSFVVNLGLVLSATPWYGAQTLFGVFELVNTGGIFSSPSSEHGQRIRDNISQYVEQIAVAIRIANQ